MEELVVVIRGARIAAREIAEVVADRVRPLRRHLRRQDLPRAGLRPRRRLDDEGHRCIAEDEGAIALAPVHVGGGHFRHDHEGALRLAEPDGLTMNSDDDSLSGLRVPAAIAAALRAFSRWTNSLNATHSSSFSRTWDGCHTPWPVIEVPVVVRGDIARGVGHTEAGLSTRE